MRRWGRGWASCCPRRSCGRSTTPSASTSCRSASPACPWCSGGGHTVKMLHYLLELLKNLCIFSQCPEKASTRAFSLLTAPYEIRLRIYANIANQTVGRMLVSSSRSHCSKLKCYTILQRSTASNEFNFIQHSQHYHPAVTVRTMLHFHLLSKFQFYCSEKSSNCKLSDGVNANFHWKLLLFIYSGFPSSFNKI